MIAVRERVGQPPQHNDADAVAGNRSPRIRVERPAMAVGRNDSAFLIEEPFFLRERNGRAARQRHVALVIQKILAGEADRDQRGGTGGLNGEARTAKV